MLNMHSLITDGTGTSTLSKTHCTQHRNGYRCEGDPWRTHVCLRAIAYNITTASPFCKVYTAQPDTTLYQNTS